MTVSATACFPYPHDTGVPFRFHLSLAASVAFHLLFAQVLTPEVPHRSALVVDGFPITVRIERMRGPAPRGPVEGATEALDHPRQMEKRPANIDARVRGAQQNNVVVETSPPLPLIPDPTVYAARDLDSYPRPVVPLDTGRLEALGGGKPVVVRIEVTIDERGIVNEVAIVGSGPAAWVEKELSAMLAATSFMPARKDGRAVKSRVLLSIVLAAGNPGR
jgi:hypothetical protein